MVEVVPWGHNNYKLSNISTAIIYIIIYIIDVVFETMIKTKDPTKLRRVSLINVLDSKY